MTRVSRAPRFQASEAEDFARRLFRFEGAGTPLPSERDQNFLLVSASGEKRVLKIANPEEKRKNLELQNAAMAHLAGGSAPVPATAVFPAADGRLIAEAVDRDGLPHAVRLVSYIEGTPLGKISPHTRELLSDLGGFIGRLSNRLASFHHPAGRRNLIWDVRFGEKTVAAGLPLISDPGRRDLAAHLLERAGTVLGPLWDRLPRSIIHNDANDYNLIIARPEASPFAARRVAGLIDFGDMVFSVSAAEPAVACAYAMLGKDDPLAAAAAVVSGCHAVRPLNDLEREVLFPLIVLRLLMSVAICARQAGERPDNEYLKISNTPAWALLEQLRTIPFSFALYVFRGACGLPPHPAAPALGEWLASAAASGEFAPVAGGLLKDKPKTVFDLSAGSTLIPNPAVLRNPAAWGRILEDEMRGKRAGVGIGRYDEARLPEASEGGRMSGCPTAEGRTVHLGLDVFAPPGTPVFSPADGVVKFARDNDARLDHGSTIILEHRAGVAGPGGRPLVYYTLYGRLGRAALEGMEPGRTVGRGERIAGIGDPEENGNRPPHLHFQIILDLLEGCGDFPGFGRASERDVWLSLCPDPNLILGMDPKDFADPHLQPGDVLALRREHLGPSLSVSYRRPLNIVRGFGQYLYDHTGGMYLDAVNNVPHVGHSHPRVVSAAAGQAAVLNTNTRYLHDVLARYIERLAATLPAPLEVCYLVNSGSEANDLALRLARHYTGRRDMIVLPGAYHGHLTSLIEISPYKFEAKGGIGCPPHTQVAENPYLYRGIYREEDPDAGGKYAASVGACLDRIAAEGRRPAGFIAESLLSCGGQIVLPEGYLKDVYRRVREAGGLCLADEVQVGFGRIGSHFWGFETQGVVPDIVTMGKPIGNGFPLAAVVTNRRIADAFASGPEYFNTFGGNPVSLAAGQAVLDVLAEERLQENALRVGGILKAGLERLQLDHPLIGDVRGLGLFLGVELVSDRTARRPAAAEAAYAAERMREEGVLVSADGPDRNVLKIKPPLCFSAADAERLVETLDRILDEEPLC